MSAISIERLHLPAGSTAHSPFALDLDPAGCGWNWCGLQILQLQPGGEHQWNTQDQELIVLPLQGGCTVALSGEHFVLQGRDSVFASTTDFVYVPIGSDVVLRSVGGGRFALPATKAQQKLSPAYHPANDVNITLRGAGSCSRQINSVAMDGFAADHLMVCEILTPAGNWSSYPPHKHDENRSGECALEEIYYFEIAPSSASPGMAYQRVYGTPDRPIDVLAEVHSGDVVLVPHGWHGPSIAAPGHDLYYLNVMGGPNGRTWQVCYDPAHEWVMDTWETMDIDPRLPRTGPPK